MQNFFLIASVIARVAQQFWSGVFLITSVALQKNATFCTGLPVSQGSGEKRDLQD